MNTEQELEKANEIIRALVIALGNYYKYQPSYYEIKEELGEAREFIGLSYYLNKEENIEDVDEDI